MSGGARRPPVYTKVHISCTGNVYRHDFVLYRCLRPSPVVVPVSLGPCAGTGRWGVPVAGGGVGDRGLAARRWCRLCCNGCCSQGVVASNRRACVATSWGRRRWTCSRTCSRGPRTTTRSPEVAWYDENDGSQSRGTSSSLSRTTPSPSSRPTWTATAMRRRSGRALGDDTVAWYENDGSQSSTERTITTLADGPTDTPRRVAQLPPW